jgi:RNA polymerase sigma-70 factor (ECF subfamily)
MPDPLTTAYTEHAPSVARYLYRHVADPATADDIASHTWERIARYMQRNPAHVITVNWLITCAHNTLVDHCRSHRHTQWLAFEDELADPHDTADTVINRITVDHALRLVSPLRRRVLELRFLDGHTVDETAAALGIPVGSVKSATFCACESLRVQFGLAPVPPPRSNRK